MISKKRQFDKKYLDHFCLENKIIYHPISEKEKITRETVITGKCKSELCNNDFDIK